MIPSTYIYHPAWFYGIVMAVALVHTLIAAYLSNIQESQPYQLSIALLGLCIPAVVALTMIFCSGNGALIEDFWHRLFLFPINQSYLLIILFLMPLVLFVATGLSLLFGYTAEQFSVTKEFTAMKGSAVVGMLIPIVLAPLIEELGWRGYGIDSLAAYYTLFTTCVVGGALWSLWHLPTFFIKGFYQNQIWHQSKLYALNFFVSAFVISFIMNWVYFKTDRSIPALILFHSVLNLSSMLLRTEQFTKCIVTFLFSVIAVCLIIADHSFFFSLIK